MQKAPVMKGSGLKPLEETKSNEEVHVFGKNLEDRIITQDDNNSPSISFTSSQPEQHSSEEDIESIKKRKFDAITGEEDEETIFQGDFKLFVWDLGSSNWIEKGRGQLKLNDTIDSKTPRSRLIMRISGTLRIILNVAIRRSFRIIASSKTNLRFTDSRTVWAASGSNAQQLKNLIEERLLTLPAEGVEPTKKPKSDEKSTESSKSQAKDEDKHEGQKLQEVSSNNGTSKSSVNDRKEGENKDLQDQQPDKPNVELTAGDGAEDVDQQSPPHPDSPNSISSDEGHSSDEPDLTSRKQETNSNQNDQVQKESEQVEGAEET